MIKLLLFILSTCGGSVECSFHLVDGKGAYHKYILETNDQRCYLLSFKVAGRHSDTYYRHIKCGNFGVE